MGLGLVVVKWIVNYHGWAISVSSKGKSTPLGLNGSSEKGTGFTILIPLS